MSTLLYEIDLDGFCPQIRRGRSDTSPQAAYNVLAVRFDDTLLPDSDHREKKIPEQRLHLGMEMQLRLLKYQCGIRISQKACDENRKYLTHANTNMGQVLRSAAMRNTYGSIRGRTCPCPDSPRCPRPQDT